MIKRSIMKNVTCNLLVLFISLHCWSQEFNTHPTMPVLDDFVSLFASPPLQYKSVPFFVWNDKMSKKQIDQMMQGFKDAGCGGVFIHPRVGLITEYLSDDWFELFNYTVEVGKKLDINVWLYDENSYPSGFAGGYVPDLMPESYNQGTSLSLLRCEMLPVNVKNMFVVLSLQKGLFIDITTHLDSYKDKKGQYYLFKKLLPNREGKYSGFSYVDLLLPGVTEKFLDITLKGYEKHAGTEFSKLIPGVFTDEPNINMGGGIRWTPNLFNDFYKRYGYDLKLNLVSLYDEVGDWKKIRHNYQQLLLQLFIDRWSKPYFKYTEAKKLIWTGHYWEHGWPGLEHGGDNMAMYAWHQMPGVDMLFNQFDDLSPNAQFGNIRAIKELSSVANQMGRCRTLSETYGGGGWDETFKDFKRLGDWEYVLGVNFMNQHLSHTTIAGSRKTDYPPEFNDHSPWWRLYKPLNDYFARLSFALSSGKQINDILIIEPTTSLWLYATSGKANPQQQKTGAEFQKFVTQLEKSQVEYDLGSENIIKDHGNIKGNNFIIGQRSYNTVVIPPLCENLDQSTFNLLSEYIHNGGKLLAFSIPTRVNGKINEDFSILFGKKNVIKLSSLSNQTIESHFHSKRLLFGDYTFGDLYHHRRQLKDGELIFLANSSMKNAAIGKFFIKGKQAMAFDPYTGTMKPYSFTKDKEKLSVKFNLAPAGSLLLYISNVKNKMMSQSNEELSETFSNCVVSQTTIKRLHDNALLIDFCDLTINNEKANDLQVAVADDRIFKHFGFKEGNPWMFTQYKQRIVERDTFSTGFKADFHFTIENTFDFSNLKVVVEHPELYNVSINGTLISAIPGQWWFDRHFGVFPVGNFVQKGRNTITVEALKMSVFAELSQVYIVGDFSVYPTDKGWKIKLPDTLLIANWRNIGLPMYSNEVAYTKTMTVNDVSKSYYVRLGEWKGTVVEILVNGQSAGILVSNPWQMNISKYLRLGINEVSVIVVGSHRNLLGPHHKNPGIGNVRPWMWRENVPYPSGDKYKLYDYGLLSDFEIVTKLNSHVKK